MVAGLTKSNYLLGKQCEKALWLRFHQADLADPVGPALQRLFLEGQVVGKLAHGLFPNGRLVSSPSNNWTAAAEETKPLIARAETPIFEAAALYNDIFIRADILEPVKAGWNLIEVKSSTSVKPDHIDDLAIQWHVLSGIGLPLHRAFLLHINKNYVRAGDIDIDAFFLKEDVTAEVTAAAADIPREVSRFRQVIEARTVPTIDVGSHCGNPHECRFSDHCWASVSPLSIHYLPRINDKKRVLLKEQGIHEQLQVPDDFDLSDTQMKWVAAAKAGKPIFNKAKLAALLSTLRYPLTFLDFESVNLAVPPYDGLRPLMQLPFQASVRILEANADQRHEEFLGNGRDDPRPALAQFLADVVPRTGSVVAYFATFERSRLNELAEAFPQFEKELNGISARLWDLLDIFSKGHYLDARFQGSTSIKNVLPVLVPEMSYADMAIRGGTEATAAYVRLMFEELRTDEREALQKELKDYCGQDTLAMVRILEVLQTIVR